MEEEREQFPWGDVISNILHPMSLSTFIFFFFHPSLNPLISLVWAWRIPTPRPQIWCEALCSHFKPYNVTKRKGYYLSSGSQETEVWLEEDAGPKSLESTSF
jgi:hypothetical protein